ncbi:G-I-Y Y-I-G endonuclease [Arthrobacter phage Wildwest]|uniref:G-I-Y Y-I-G endonuclease n=1 Tax=Arthrobacter phage Wildwest TaxID=3051767 RepID=A0AA96HTK2_9CAUD|nr:G-I-Y Y-I-G endonuclease [Arthrobacter phage Wildwest]
MKTTRTPDGKTLTPWGFCLEDAFALLRMNAAAKRMGSERRASRPYDWKPCKFPNCPEEQKGTLGYCAKHGERLKDIRRRKWEAQRAEVKRREEEERRERVLLGLARREDARELEAARKIVRNLRREREAARPKKRYTGPARPGFVYRLFDDSGALLYVGKTYNVRARLFTGPTAHSLTKEWFSKVALAKVAAYRTEADALEAEAWAIKREAPLHNVAAPTPKKSRAPRPVAVYEGAL